MHPPNLLNRQLIQHPFHQQDLLRQIWGHAVGVCNEIGHVRKVLMHRPGPEVLLLHGHARILEAGPALQEEIEGRQPQEEKKEEDQLPSLSLLQEQHDALTRMLQKEGIQVVSLEGAPSHAWPERLFTRDLGLLTPSGAIVPRLALHLRYGETRLAAQTLLQEECPILGTIQGRGYMEGGSFLLLNEKTALIGRSERVNLEGIEQLRYLLALQQIELLVMDLPSTIIHLDEALLLLDRDLALVHTSLLPYWFLHHLIHLGFRLIHVDPRDPPLTINALTISPRRVIFPASGRHTQVLLERHGVEVLPVEVDEIYKLGGGIHCVTLPLVRDP